MKRGKGYFLRLLGDRTLAEVRKYYIGMSINQINPNSVIGRYIENTKALTKIVQVPIEKNGSELGPPKLLVAVSQNSWKEFEKVIATPYFMTVTGHANIIHKDRFYSFGGQISDVQILSENTPMPFLILKTTEADRLSYYLSRIPNQGEYGWGTALKLPWLNGNGQYCAQGGYSCCTHWIGNIPIGDKLVNEYKFPSRDGSVSNAKVKKLEEFDGPIYLKRIWKVPGHEQLASAIGMEEANLLGNFASPGWVIQSLMGAASTDRVPVIFVMTPDHTTTIPEISQFNFEYPH